mmetsp:Transcript_25770/g.55456  ORF Transcript_25770/g.55456 Transcript_25770/m.55456 type:complete len:337 (+) Transcript_25770:1-1011(+)
MTMHHASRSRSGAHSHPVAAAALHRPRGQVANPQADVIGWQQGQLETALLKEEMRRRLNSNAATATGACGGTPHPSIGETLKALGYHGDFGSAMNVSRRLFAGQRPRGASQDHSPQIDRAAMASNVNVDGGAHSKKHSENFEDLYSKHVTSSNMTTVASASAKPAAAASEQRDLALMARLLARGSNKQAAAQHALLGSLARGHRTPRGAPHHYPPAHQAVARYPRHHHRGTSHAAAGLHNHSYAALLSQLATSGQHPVAGGGGTPPSIPPPSPSIASASYPGASASAISPPKQKRNLIDIVHAASSQSGLSYNDIIKGVWKDINQDDAENHYDGGS